MAALLSLFVIANGPLATLQTFAWGKMLWEYSQEHGWINGTKQTFDGAHPCSLCLTIQKAKDTESKNPVLVSSKKIELFQELFPCPLPAPNSTLFSYPRPGDLASESHRPSPPSPIPIAVPDIA